MSKNGMSDDDKALFRLAMQGVKPLQNNRSPEAPPQAVARLPRDVKPLKNPPRKEPMVALSLSDYTSEEAGAETVLSWCRSSLSSQRFAELKKGLIRREGRLDLHGLQTASAETALLDFIAGEHVRHHRCLLIIHGKGSPQGQAPILKNLVNAWLRQIPQVLAFHSALPKDGGTGALYLLLKRNRDEMAGSD